MYLQNTKSRFEPLNLCPEIAQVQNNGFETKGNFNRYIFSVQKHMHAINASRHLFGSETVAES